MTPEYFLMKTVLDGNLRYAENQRLAAEARSSRPRDSAHSRRSRVFGRRSRRLTEIG